MKLAIPTLAAILAIIALTLVVVFKINGEQNQRISDTQSHLIQRAQRLQQGQIDSSCHRLNVLRASDNHNQYLEYRYFVTTTQYLTNSSKLQSTNLRRSVLGHFIKHYHKYVKAYTKLQNEFLGRLRYNSSNLTWVPLTDCNVAQKEGIHYSTPSPIRFSVKIPTPREAFKLGPNN